MEALISVLRCRSVVGSWLRDPRSFSKSPEVESETLSMALIEFILLSAVSGRRLKDEAVVNRVCSSEA